MPIISVRDNENNRWKSKEKKTTTNKQIQKGERGHGSRESEMMRAKWFCCAFKLGFSPINM